MSLVPNNSLYGDLTEGFFFATIILEHQNLSGELTNVHKLMCKGYSLSSSYIEEEEELERERERREEEEGVPPFFRKIFLSHQKHYTIHTLFSRSHNISPQYPPSPTVFTQFTPWRPRNIVF